MSDSEERRDWRVVHHGEDRRDTDGGRILVVERPTNGNGNGKHGLSQTIGVVLALVLSLGGIGWALLSQGVSIADLAGRERETRQICSWSLTKLENRISTQASLDEIRRVLDDVRKQLGDGDNQR